MKDFFEFGHEKKSYEILLPHRTKNFIYWPTFLQGFDHKLGKSDKKAISKYFHFSDKDFNRLYS